MKMVRLSQLKPLTQEVIRRVVLKQGRRGNRVIIAPRLAQTQNNNVTDDDVALRKKIREAHSFYNATIH